MTDQDIYDRRGATMLDIRGECDSCYCIAPVLYEFTLDDIPIDGMFQYCGTCTRGWLGQTRKADR